MYFSTTPIGRRSLGLLLGLALLTGLPAWAAELINGGVVSGSIAIAGQEDRYTFYANAGETVALTAAKTSSSLIPYIRLFSPTGAAITSDYGSSVASIQHSITASGTYTVLVSDSSVNRQPTSTGGYEARLARMPGANEHGALVNGGVQTEQITLGDLDTYTFYANVGETVALTAAKTSGSLIPYIRLFSPTGAAITSDYGSSVASIQHSITASGTYTVLVSDSSVNRQPTSTGGYEARLARMPGANEHGALVNGGVRTEQITLGDLDTYTFYANAGETVALTAAKTSGSLIPYIRLFSPTGAGLASDYNSSVASIQLSIAASGTYTVLVSDSSVNRPPTSTGGYEARLARMPGANEHGALVNGGVRTEQITLGDLDTYTFYANAGETVALTAAKTSGSLIPYIRLFSPTGAGLANDYNSSVASIQLSIAASGTYTVLVSDSSVNRPPTSTGGYEAAFTIFGNRLSYAALGDSYSSGEGLFPYLNPNDHYLTYPGLGGLLDPVYEALDLDGGCHRSARAYPYQVRLPGSALPLAHRADVSFDFFACTGAETENVSRNGEALHREPPQLTFGNAINETRDLITISIGGNDAYWAPITSVCLIHPDCNGLQPFLPHSAVTLGEIASPLAVAFAEAQVRALHAELRSAAPNAAIVVLGYPLLVSGLECPALQLPGDPESKLSAGEQSFLRQANIALNTAVERSAADNGLQYVASAAHFAGHEACGTSDDWVNGVAALNPAGSFHPTARGQSEFARLINEHLEAAAARAPQGLLPNGLPRNPIPAARFESVRLSDAGNLPSIGLMVVRPQGIPTSCRGANGVAIAGQPIAIVAGGFVPNESVMVTLAIGSHRQFVANVSADSNGVLNSSVVMPGGIAPGVWGAIEALGAGANGLGALRVTTVRFETSSSVDSDADGVPDICDNCSAKPNPDQLDTDRDGYGNICDADFDNNGIVNTLDLATLKAAFGQRGDDKATDLDGNFIVNTLDLAIFKSLFGKPSGPAFKTPGPN